MANSNKKADIPKEKIPILKTGSLASFSKDIKTIGLESLDLVAREELLNQNTTWADPDPFQQLEQKNPKKNIGVANPYVLAPILLNTRIDWNNVNALETLMAAFAPTGSKSYADIFTSKNSVIFSQKKIDRLLIARSFSPSTIHGAETGSGAAPPTGKVATAYGTIIASANYPPPSAPKGSQPPAPLPFKINTNNNVKDIVDDSMQGACVDCYFIAALYSRVWCSYPAFPPAPTACANGGCNVTFYTPTCGSVTKCATPTFPIDDNKQPVFAQMTTEWELWTALYEKAYAMFIGLTKSTLPNATATDPEIKTFPQGDPLLSLAHITKMKWDFTNNNTINQPSAFLTSDLSQFNFVSSYAAMNKDLSAVIGGTTSRKTLYPTVAWTYDTKPACSSTWFGATSPYGNDLIVPSHSYSILGSVTLKDNAGITRNYIVLRNPWGANYVGDPSGSIGQYLAVGQFTPATGISFDLGRKPNGITTDGIFGLRSEVFDCCFRGFGWVPFRCA